MLFVVWALWNGQGNLTISETIDTLEEGNL